MSLRVIPCFHKGSRDEVHAYIARHHRHHDPPVGEVFRLACVDGDGKVRGVATIGRPVGRFFDDGWTLEVTRVATDGVRNGCSFLYGAARRIAWVMGARTIYTYTLPSEGGASLRAAGWTDEGCAGGAGWSSRQGRLNNHPETKTRWSCQNPRAFDGSPVWPVADEEEPPLLALMGVTP